MNKRIALFLASVAGASLTVAVALPAGAQSWNYNPYTGGATWLGMANMLMYPFNRYSSVGAPLYLASPLIWGGSYYANQALTNGSRRFTYGNYNAEEPVFDPRQRTRPVVSDGNGVVDQITHAQRHGGDPSPVPNTGDSLPPGRTAPLAQGFIDLVNDKYQGDISKALFDPQARSYAHSIGLISSDEIFDADLSQQKVNTIRGILADDKEDAALRINTVRMLLKH